MSLEKGTRSIYYVNRPTYRRAQPVSISLDKAIESFLIACQARKLSPHTLEDYQRTLYKLLLHTGNCDVRQIGSAQIAAFLAAQPYKAKTVLNYHIGLSAFWTWLVREDYASKHIMRAVEKPRPQQVAVEPFSEVEVRAMLQAVRANPDRDRAIILLLLDTGIRASELCGLKRDDIDITARKIKVLGKGNKERLIPFSARTGQGLSEWLAREGGRPFRLSRTSLARLLQGIGHRAGIRSAHPHRFRHTFAVTYLRNGGDPYTLQDDLGHSTMEMVKHYLRIAEVDIEAAHVKASPVTNWNL